MSKVFDRIKNLVKAPARGRAPVGQTPADVIWTENKWKLLRYRPRPEGLAFETPILLVPSLINRHYVLDLMKGKSFAEWMVAQGHDVYIIDWGTPGPEDRYLTFDEICDGYIGRAVRKVARRSPRQKTHVLGYCMGGTMTSIYTARRPEHVASLLALAAPIDFDHGGILTTWTRVSSFDLDSLIEATGNVPWPLMQSAFHMLRPTMNLSKATYMIDRAWDDQFLDGFFAIETWGNDNVSFPGTCYKRYINELYRDNLLIKDQFSLSGEAVKLENITCPTLAICFLHDHIVPLPSAEILIDRVSSEDKQCLRLNGGHVGAVVSSKASQGLWPTISTWFAERDGANTPKLHAAAGE